MIGRTKQWGFLDYLTQELENTFRREKKIWEQNDNHKEKRSLVIDTIERAKILYDLQKETNLGD